VSDEGLKKQIDYEIEHTCWEDVVDRVDVVAWGQVATRESAPEVVVEPVKFLTNDHIYGLVGRLLMSRALIRDEILEEGRPWME